ncbi:MAG: hypothetical protein OXN89_24690, partial [Bryobacterales bacterium]|nr:hypothetical protein [Bryobacterales bacterium]
MFRSETMELQAGDRVRFTRNDPSSDLTNGQVAEVESLEKDGVRFRLEDGTHAKLGGKDAQLGHIDHAWASTIHSYQGRTVDRIVAAMPVGNRELVNQKSFYVVISRARDAAELITNDPERLADQLQRATGERVAALDAVAPEAELDVGKDRQLAFDLEVGEAESPNEAAQSTLEVDRESDRTDEREGWTDQEMERDGDSQDSVPQSERKTYRRPRKYCASWISICKHPPSFRPRPQLISQREPSGLQARFLSRTCPRTGPQRVPRSWACAGLSRARIDSLRNQPGISHAPVRACAPWENAESLGKT